MSRNPRETMKIGETFAKTLKRGNIVAFWGELGSGKTTMIKGICRKFGIRENVKSPSYVLLRIYRGEITIYHFDFYRIVKREEIINTGLEDYLNSAGIVVIEWADRVESLLPESRYDVFMKIIAEKERKITISRKRLPGLHKK
jgi:tRNA threonylcarbamoyladenosine biosynthesis protein TsaE